MASNVTRAQGCLMGQFAGDALGSLVEFQSPEQIRCHYPDGVRDMHDGGTWGTIAGQPTDDSEMVIALARSIVRNGGYSPKAAFDAYSEWLNSGPFDCGNTVRSALSGSPNLTSEANGAMMRAAPLGIWRGGSDCAAVDARLTHPNPVCVAANVIYVDMIADAVHNGTSPGDLYAGAVSADMPPSLRKAVSAAQTHPPVDYLYNQGWVLIALHNALYQLLHAPDFETGIIDTVMRGGDTDTNAAICGALLGAVYGIEAIPERWARTVLRCRPDRESGTRHPRPSVYWPTECLELAEKLITVP